MIPGVADPNTLAVSFHKSYMPVVAAGTQADPVMVNPAKRYFVSVLPTESTYSNSGAAIEAGQTAVTITVAEAAAADRAHPGARVPGQRAAQRHVGQHRARPRRGSR